MEKEKVEQICQRLQQEDRRAKILALQELEKFCENPKPNHTDVLTVFDECYLHILKCYSDRYESVREQSARTVSQFIKRLPPNDFHLANIIATLAERMGRDETLEGSEEIRLMYIEQLNSLITHNTQAQEALFSLFDAFGLILKKATQDAHPAVQREACAVVVLLSKSVKRSQNFQKLADLLTKSIYGLLNHKHSLVRISAVEALSHLALHIDCSGDSFSRLLMEVSPLLMDSMPLVRRECGKMGTMLLMDLNDRYSYFDRLIPLVLCCLKDESPEVVEYIRPLWIKCGKQYFEENEAELSKQEIADVKAENYPAGVERPTIGCRALVQRSLRLLTLITKESADWKDNVRLHSLRLLYQFVLHAEAAMTAKFFEIYPDVARACRDDEQIVSMEAMKVADLMGRLFSYKDWFDHAFEGLANNAREGYLKCFYSMFNATTCDKIGFEDLEKISKLLATPEFSQCLKPTFQIFVIKLAETVLQKTHKKYIDHDYVDEVEKNIFIATIKILALAYNTDANQDSEITKKSETIFQVIAARQAIPLAALYEKYVEYALEFVQNLDANLDGFSEPIMLLNGLISIAKFRAKYLDKLKEKILEVWQNCSSDAKIKVLAVISTEIFRWSETIGRELTESADLLASFLKAVIEEHLTWRAGATAEALRALAAATLCSVAQGAAAEAKIVLPSFARYMPALLEDHLVRTRHYAIKSLANFGEVPVEEIKPIAYAILQRLDDPSNDIRTLAVIVISQLRPKFEEPEQEGEREIWKTFLKKALEVLIIHYEGPDSRIKDHIKGVIIDLANDYPEIVAECFKLANDQHSSTAIIQSLQAELRDTLHINF